MNTRLSLLLAIVATCGVVSHAQVVERAGDTAVILIYPDVQALPAGDSEAPDLMASLGAEVKVLDPETMLNIRGERWEYGFYARGVLSADRVKGIPIGGSLEYRYNITDRSGKLIKSFTLPVSEATVAGMGPSLGVGGPGEAVAFTIRAGVPVEGFLADLGFEGGKYVSGSRKGKYYLEFLGGVGAGKPAVSVGAKINGAEIKFSSRQASATMGMWARSWGSKTEILFDVSGARRAVITALPLLR